MKIVCVIPARLQSTRFPRKIFAMLERKPLLQWVWEAAEGSEIFDEIVFAIDDRETARLIESFGGRFLMTSPECQSGTDRLVELIKTKQMVGDIWVNWQCDEPFIHREIMEDLLRNISQKNIDVWTLKKKITAEEEIDDPNIVKIVTTKEGKALYFSRFPIPYCQQFLDFEDCLYFKHVGIYAFTDKALRKIDALPLSHLERVEQLEQLRFLEHGFNIQVVETEHETIGIDRPEDLVRARDFLLGKVL